MNSGSRQSPIGVSKRKKEVDLNSQNQMFKYLISSVPTPSGKKAVSIKTEISSPPAKKAKSNCAKVEESGILTVSSDTSDIESVFDEEELLPTPVKKRKAVVKKLIPRSSYFELPFAFKDPSTPVKGKKIEQPRSALVNINREKQKKPLLSSSCPVLVDNILQPNVAATTSQEISATKFPNFKKKTMINIKKDESSRKNLLDLGEISEVHKFKSSWKHPNSLSFTDQPFRVSPLKSGTFHVIPNENVKTCPLKNLSTFTPCVLPEIVSTSKEGTCILPNTPVQPLNITEHPLKNLCSFSALKNEVSEQPKVVRRVVRHSNLNVHAELKRLSVASKFEVGLNEIISAAGMDFQSTYKDVETILEMKTFNQSCPDILQASKNKRSLLAIRYHTNFNFFLSRDNQEIAAIGALRRLSRHLYPLAEDCHTILFRIIGKTNDRMALFRGQEFLDNLMSLHPPCNQMMRDYYWSIMSQQFDDANVSNRWENVRSLLSDMLKASNVDFENNSELNSIPNPLERTRVTLAFIVRLLEEDLLCWVRLLQKDVEESSGPASLLRRKIDVPLMARLLWPHSDIGHVSLQCRELIALHISAIELKNSGALCYTTSLMKILSTVMQLSDLHLPLKLRFPSERLSELTREIMNSTISHVISSEAFIASFHSTELRLLISAAVLNRLDPSMGVSFLSGVKFDLKNMLSVVLGMNDKTSNREVITRFRSRPVEFQRSFSIALSAYFKLFGVQKTWYVLRQRYKKSLLLLERQSQEPIDMFSHSYPEDQLFQDMKQTKTLLQCGNGAKMLFSLFCPSR